MQSTMAQPSDLQAARESFIQGIMRFDSDNGTVARSAAETIANDICRVANKCTKHGVEIAKDELLAGVLVLPSRTSNLRDYLYALSRAYSPRDLKVKVDTSKPGDENIGLGKVVRGKVQQPPQPAFKRLHLLYLMHSVLVHIKDHPDAGDHDWYHRMISFYAPLYDQLRPIVTTLARLAVCACTGKKVVRTLDTVLHVVSIWQAKDIFSAAECDEIKRLVKEADMMEWDEMLGVLDAEDARKKANGTWPDTYDWVVPDRHSNLDNPNAPWHELPAANGLLMKRTRGYPMRFVAFPNGGYALEDAGYRARPDDILDIKEVFKQIAHARSKWTDPDEVYDIDPLGNIVWQDTDLSTYNQWGMELGRIQWNKDLAGSFAKMEATGYGDFPPVPTPGVESAVERAKQLAAGRGGNEMSRGRGRGRPYGMGGGDRGRGRGYGDRGGDRGHGYGRGGGERRGAERDYGNGNGYGGYGRGSGGDRGGYREYGNGNEQGGYGRGQGGYGRGDGEDRGGYRGRYRGDRRGGYEYRGRGYRDRGRW